MEHDAQIQRLKGLTSQRACGSWPAVLSLVCVLLRGASGIPAHANQIIVAASKDNTLYETADGSTSNARGTAMFAGRNSQQANSIRRALMRFDVAAHLLAGSTIRSVQLVLHNSTNNIQDEVLSLHRAVRDWGEGTSIASGSGGGGGPATTNDATWLHTFFDTQFWSTAGGDFQLTPSATQVVGDVGFYRWGPTPEMIADVQGWLDDAGTNFGWFVTGNEAVPSTAKRFSTREDPDPTWRPSLLVEFTLPPGIPTVSVWGLTTLGISLVLGGTLIATKRLKDVPGNSQTQRS